MSYHHYAVAELQSETKFPTAMSYGSDKQWSDSATVCSTESDNELAEVAASPPPEVDTTTKATSAPHQRSSLLWSHISRLRHHEVSADSSSSKNAEKESKDPDCDASLDVETQSIGGRSFGTVLSHEDGVAASFHETIATDLGMIVPALNSGRLSPGGTIYKGRGERRYKGRYMHLPLKRFHHQLHDSTSTIHSGEPNLKRRATGSQQRPSNGSV